MNAETIEKGKRQVISMLKKEYKQKIKRVINEQFIKALNSRHIRIQEQHEQDRRKIEELNNVCKEWKLK